MNKSPFTQGFLLFLQYNRRFQECCFLLKIRSNLYKKEPLPEFWKQREQHYLEWDYIPQTRSFLDYDIERVCTICGLENNRDNVLLIFTCAHYGVWRTTRWLLKHMKEKGEKEKYDVPLTTAFMVIRYLASLLADRGDIGRVDYITYGYIEKVTDWLNEKGWGDFHMEKPCQSAKESEQKKFKRDIYDTLPLQIRILIEQINNSHQENGQAKRRREDRRNYIYWRWRRQGMKMLEIAEKWDQLESKEEPTQEKVVGMALGKYLKECGPLLTNPTTLDYYKMLSKYYDKRTAADRTLEKVYREVVEEEAIAFPIKEEIKIK